VNQGDAQLDLRSLRYFVAAAEELHFTRAAARLFVAQQALSREIQRLERDLGVELFLRTTRRVALTPAGERLLSRARHILSLHDLTVRELRTSARPLIVDLLSDGRLAARRILDAARDAAPGLEFRGRYAGGLGGVLGALMAGDVDVAFGRAAGLGRPLPVELTARLIRLEPLALLLPETHDLARYAAVPLGALHGLEIDAGLGNPRAPEWGDLAEQLLRFVGARSTPPHEVAEGLEEQAHHLVRQGLPILTAIDHRPVPGGVIRGLSDPVPLYPWSIVYRRDERSAGVAALEAAAAQLGTEEGWLSVPDDAWLPDPESESASGP
jgi:DNA-binding transcriptional LysR family regulator